MPEVIDRVISLSTAPRLECVGVLRMIFDLSLVFDPLAVLPLVIAKGAGAEMDQA